MTSAVLNKEPLNHLCWSLSLQNPYDGKVKIGGCSCLCLESLSINEKTIPNRVVDNFKKNGLLVFEGKDEEVFIFNSGKIITNEDNKNNVCRD